MFLVCPGILETLTAFDLFKLFQINIYELSKVSLPVDNTALSDIGITNKTDSHGMLNVLISRVILY